MGWDPPCVGKSVAGGGGGGGGGLGLAVRGPHGAKLGSWRPLVASWY